jgi:hypothetical protein
LADPFVVSERVKTVECCGIGEGNQKWSGDNCVSAGRREQELRVKLMGTRDVNWFALEKRVPVKGVITG